MAMEMNETLFCKNVQEYNMQIISERYQAKNPKQTNPVFVQFNL